MNTNGRIYATEEKISALGVQYFFLSNGQANIVKLINYSLVDVIDDELIFNLAFGDHDIKKNALIDNVNTNNGDAYIVFNTVLNTVPLFFNIFGNVTLTVQGSDSDPDYPDICRQSCRKNCINNCKNADRRIAVYRHYVNKNFELLNITYTFEGGFITTDNQITRHDYTPGEKYDIIFVRKKT